MAEIPPSKARGMRLSRIGVAERIGGGARDRLLVAPAVVLGDGLDGAGRVRPVRHVSLLVEDVFGRGAARRARDEAVGREVFPPLAGESSSGCGVSAHSPT